METSTEPYELNRPMFWVSSPDSSLAHKLFGSVNGRVHIKDAPAAVKDAIAAAKANRDAIIEISSEARTYVTMVCTRYGLDITIRPYERFYLGPPSEQYHDLMDAVRNAMGERPPPPCGYCGAKDWSIDDVTRLTSCCQSL